jgi:plastocyanin
MIHHLPLTVLASVAGFTATAVAWPDADTVIRQKNREFSVQEMTVAAGSYLAFSNDDEFPHQISARGPGVATSSALQRTGEVLRILVPEPGITQVRCGIHPRMRLTIRAE